MSFVKITSVETPSVRWRADALIPRVDMLHFPFETQGALTPFREQVLNYIYRTTLGLSKGLLVSATVAPVSEPSEENSLHLHLGLTIDMGWDELDQLHDQILARVVEWSRDWSAEEQEDYGRWIYFSLTPSRI